MVIYFLQAGCSPPVVPVLQKDFPELFRSSNTEVLDQLTREIPIQVQEFKSANKQSLGELLIAFFRYYSAFQWADIIAIRTGTILDNMYSRIWRGPKIRIEDPTDRGNVTRAVFDEYEARRIKNAFKLASTNLNENASLESVLWLNDLKKMNLARRYICITELGNFCWYICWNYFGVLPGYAYGKNAFFVNSHPQKIFHHPNQCSVKHVRFVDDTTRLQQWRLGWSIRNKKLHLTGKFFSQQCLE